MKKFIAIVLMCLYLVSVIGITVKAHYCGGKLTSIAFNIKGVEKCKCGSKKMKKNCCQTKTCSISIKEVQNKSGEINYGFSNYNYHLSILSTPNTSATLQLAVQSFCKYNQEALFIKAPPYLLYQVFRI